MNRLKFESKNNRMIEFYNVVTFNKRLHMDLGEIENLVGATAKYNGLVDVYVVEGDLHYVEDAKRFSTIDRMVEGDTMYYILVEEVMDFDFEIGFK